MNVSAIEAIKSRVSVRQYEQRPIPREVLADLIDCGRLAPTAKNEQGWQFVVVQEPDLRAQITEALQWSKFVGEAPALILVFYRKDGYCQVEDASAATENIIIAAAAHGLGTCWINSHRKPHSADVGRLVGCPDDHELVTMIAAGYPAERKPRPKRDLAEVLHWDRFP